MTAHRAFSALLLTLAVSIPASAAGTAPHVTPAVQALHDQMQNTQQNQNLNQFQNQNNNNPNTTPQVTFDQNVHTRAMAILDTLQMDQNFSAAETRTATLFDQVVAYGSDKNLDSFRDASFTLRLIRDVESVPEDQRMDLLKYLRANDNLAHQLAFMIRFDQEPASSFAVLAKLRAKHGDILDKYATLTAAICVVHNRPLVRQINENATTAPDAVAIFEYFVTYEKQMFFGVRGVPAELLLYVVDTTSSIPEMRWALSKYAGDPVIGKHFFDINYDYANFLADKPKKVTEMGYNLPNILKYGGVCADQAFFAMSIGKAIGVPTAYTTASSAEVGHAWVGFLQAAGSRGGWNFNIGRYEEYRGIRGNVLDPQTREEVPDSYISLQAELIGTNPANRQNAIALTDAASRLAMADNADGGGFKPEPLTQIFTTSLKAPRRAGIESSLELVQIALTQNVAYPRAWLLVRSLASDGKLSEAQKKRWSDALLTLCGTKYPDFALAVLEPMIGTVKDPVQQNGFWNVVFSKFQGRSDLAAQIRMDQAHMWETENQPKNAMQCYLDVINRYANAGPFIIGALAAAENLLSGNSNKIAQLYEMSWTQIQKPQDMAGPFMKQSNWYRVGSDYANRLRAAGNPGKAAEVTAQLESATAVH